MLTVSDSHIVLGGGGGGGGSTTFAGLSDKVTADLPGINTPLANALSGKEATSNKKTDVDANKTSDTFFPSVKAVFDWVSGLFVKGAASSTDNAVARFDGVTGKLLKNSVVTISDVGVISVNGVIDSTGSGGSATANILSNTGGLLVWKGARDVLKFLGGSGNIDVGSGNISNTTGSYNTNSGYAGLYSNNGSYNTNSGYAGLNANTTGSNNTNSGSYGLNANTTGDHNTNSGYAGLNANTTGNYNTNSGNYGLSANTAGSYNTNSGSYGLNANTTGSYNTRVGFGNEGLVSGSNNTILGANITVPSTANNLVLISNGTGSGLTTYTTNSEAVAAGLVTGCLWKRVDAAGGFQVMIVG